MKYSNVINPQWANSEQTSINCEVVFDALGEALIPFTAVAEGDYPHTHEIFSRCVNGDFGVVAAYEPPPSPTTEEIATGSRGKRNSLLTASDWTQLPDVPQTTKDLWAQYRQDLRDITEQAGFPTSIVWPTAPQ